MRSPFIAAVGGLVLVLTALSFGLPAALSTSISDTDGDGCSDGKELGPDAVFGGRRDPESFWDFFDVPAGEPLERDARVSAADIAAVVARFGATGPVAGTEAEMRAAALAPPPPAPAYHPAYDRGGTDALGDPWSLLPPDGAISASDIAGIVVQFGHICAGPELLGAWAEGRPMPTARTEVTSALLDGIIYVAAGFLANGTNTDLVEAYDIGGDSWSTVASLPQPLDHAGAVVVGGKFYVVGGYVSLVQGTISFATYEYDTVQNSWTEREPMPLARAAAATVALDGKIYVLGGVGPQPTTALVYDPVADDWDLLAPMAEPREHLAASVVDGRIYVVGGRQVVTQNVGTVEVYDPATGTWSPLALLPTERGGIASATLQGKVHVFGGEDLSPGGATFPQHEVYDPATDSWLPAPPLPTPRHGLTAQVEGGSIYVIGGGPAPRLSVSPAVEVFQVKE